MRVRLEKYLFDVRVASILKIVDKFDKYSQSRDTGCSSPISTVVESTTSDKRHDKRVFIHGKSRTSW